MSFLDTVSFKTSKQKTGQAALDGYPFDLPVIESMTKIDLNPGATFFVGENGSGKSSLIEAIAVGLRCPTVGAADAASDPMLRDAARLAEQLVFARSENARVKMFFRAEDAIGFTRRIQNDMADLSEMEQHYERTLSGRAQSLAKGVVRGQRQAHIQRYGEQPNARSHGQWFIELLKTRLQDKGLYLLDEPETPLSPVHQLSLLSIILDRIKHGCQFIIATHSPILMALPEATILSFDQRIEQVAWQDVEHVEITKAFLNDPMSFIRHL